MNRIWDKIFSRELEFQEEDQIIAWWEIRRIVFNLALILGALTSLLIFAAADKGLYRLNFLSIIGGFFGVILANFFYSLGWLTEVFLRKIRTDTNQWAIRTLKIILVVFFFVSVLPGVIVIIEVYSNNQKYSIPDAHFILTPSPFNRLVGNYKIDLNKADFIKPSDISKSPEIILKMDSTFSIVNFPIFDFPSKRYELCNGNGKWQIDKFSRNSPCLITLVYSRVHNAQTMKPVKEDYTDYYIYSNSLGYNIYEEVGPVGSGVGILYKKQKQ